MATVSSIGGITPTSTYYGTDAASTSKTTSSTTASTTSDYLDISAEAMELYTLSAIKSKNGRVPEKKVGSLEAQTLLQQKTM
jgi:hypothetical protein